MSRQLRDPFDQFGPNRPLGACLSLEYSSRDRHRTVVMPTLIVLLIAALVVFYLVSRPVAIQPTLRAVPIVEAEIIRAIPVDVAEQSEGILGTGASRPTSIATSEGR